MRQAARPKLSGVTSGAVSAEEPGEHRPQETMLPPRKRARSGAVKGAQGMGAAAPHLAPGFGKDEHAAVSPADMGGPPKRAEAPQADKGARSLLQESPGRGPERGHEEAAKQVQTDWEAYALDMARLAAEAEAVLAEEDDDF